MISKIIQFSTKQCGRCQQTKAIIENKLKNSSIKYEYIPLIDENKKEIELLQKELAENGRWYSFAKRM